MLTKNLIPEQQGNLEEIARNITDEYFECSMEIGKILQHPDGRTVKIKSGCFRDPTYNLISNWWTWNVVLPSGLLGPDESGYGW